MPKTKFVKIHFSRPLDSKEQRRVELKFRISYTIGHMDGKNIVLKKTSKYLTINILNNLDRLGNVMLKDWEINSVIKHFNKNNIKQGRCYTIGLKPFSSKVTSRELKTCKSKHSKSSKSKTKRKKSGTKKSKKGLFFGLFS